MKSDEISAKNSGIDTGETLEKISGYFLER